MCIWANQRLGIFMPKIKYSEKYKEEGNRHFSCLIFQRGIIMTKWRCYYPAPLKCMLKGLKSAGDNPFNSPLQSNIVPMRENLPLEDKFKWRPVTFSEQTLCRLSSTIILHSALTCVSSDTISTGELRNAFNLINTFMHFKNHLNKFTTVILISHTDISKRRRWLRPTRIRRENLRCIWGRSSCRPHPRPRPRHRALVERTAWRKSLLGSPGRVPLAPGRTPRNSEGFLGSGSGRC